ncbi:hypothetical protein [Modestobacter sp. VKM Ac-2985]|uniref:hypothetical protein n=1 Tax=Modestobacter sp. VKM Ac-2985 TaxID=3004139 RepID=UPI0022AB733D|nr:hypothetical protein [Modestobacter sp. VKM Ac-2985]MCZ2837128.1 hypothetical protein [Modestobacter sp. VKM Ac-2985]
MTAQGPLFRDYLPMPPRPTVTASEEPAVPSYQIAPQTPGEPDHAAPRPPRLARVRKAIVAGLGFGATLVAAGVLDDQTEAIVTGVLALATVLGIYRVPNEQKPAS